MKRLSQKGFTLIELLVVITIIGILATGATAVYTSAQQKARDSIRQNDILALRSAVEQAFGDKAQYPDSNQLVAGIIDSGYMQAPPQDPKYPQKDDSTIFSYIYGSAQSETTFVDGQEYEFSANFENTGNASSKEGCTGACDSGGDDGDSETNADGGNDGLRWEVGVNMDNVHTYHSGSGFGVFQNVYSSTVTHTATLVFSTMGDSS